MPTFMETRNPIIDRRQSDTALKIRQGTCRMMRVHGFSCLPELTLSSGRRADLVCIGQRGEIHIVEIKSSTTDFQSDQKWQEYRDFCDKFYFSTSLEVPKEIFPMDAGLILSDGYSAEIIREPEEQKLPSATRKSLLLRFARNAADRLYDMEDPESLRVPDS